MAKRVNNITYKGINHSPSLVSGNDGYASECANLSPDFNDLKPMPMPVCGDYTLEPSHSLVFVHQGVGYENYIEIDQTHTRLVFKDIEGHYLYEFDNGTNVYNYWSNDDQAEIIAIEAVGNTLVVSTKTGTEYIVYQPDVPLDQAAGSYKPIGQKPPMPVIQFGLKSGNSKLFYEGERIEYEDESEILKARDNNDTIYIEDNKDKLRKLDDIIKGLVSKIEKDSLADSYFIKPFFIRYAIRMKSGDYIMHSTPVLLLPSTDKCPIAAGLVLNYNDSFWPWNWEGHYVGAVKTIAFGYRVVANFISGATATDFQDWMDIVSSVDVFISSPIDNYRKEDWNGYKEKTADVVFGTGSSALPAFEIPYQITYDMGKTYKDGEIKNVGDDIQNNAGNDYWTSLTGCGKYELVSRDDKLVYKDIETNTLFYKFYSFSIDEIDSISDLELVNNELQSIETLPTLEDDYNSHCAISAKLLQTYNSRLNMANISQRVFNGFANGYQPQSKPHVTYGKCYYKNGYYYVVDALYFKVKKNGKTYIVRNNNVTSGGKLDYTSYLYYPDPECYEITVDFKTYPALSLNPTRHLYSIPMKRHEYLNGSYWYADMRCLGEYLADEGAIESTEYAPQLSANLWYDIPNRFMMSSVGNPWHFPVANMFDIGRREIRALAVNAENMDAPQFGQNPIYVFSTDGIWTIAINTDGTYNKLSYVSGDVLAEMTTIGHAPTASGSQVVFFKTDRGVMAITGSGVKEIDLVMRGKVYNPLSQLRPAYSVRDGIATAGVDSYWLDLINNVCDGLPYADFAKDADLLYDYRNDRLLLYNGKLRSDKTRTPYLYVYDVRHDFWSKMLTMLVDEETTSPVQDEYSTRVFKGTKMFAEFNGVAQAGSEALLTDTDGNVWYIGRQPDENDIPGHNFGFYVSRPLRFGTDDYKTLCRVVHDYQVTQQEGSPYYLNPEKVRMALYGSRDGKNYYQVTTFRGSSYKFYIFVLYTKLLASSRYAYTAFEWEPRFTDKIR